MTWETKNPNFELKKQKFYKKNWLFFVDKSSICVPNDGKTGLVRVSYRQEWRGRDRGSSAVRCCWMPSRGCCRNPDRCWEGSGPRFGCPPTSKSTLAVREFRPSCWSTSGSLTNPPDWHPDRRRCGPLRAAPRRTLGAAPVGKKARLNRK